MASRPVRCPVIGDDCATRGSHHNMPASEFKPVLQRAADRG
eukprot:CAMPEP_0183441310 /NCGR_PEP_ID=MMETSP0370-20130417/84354_1 /TAXON_ID=268820 /ORGANISM="Peridinium aciculiferum, Strain PAER-2" /LENGTH=40 /DNA_ID= /DNA_START= /DNA_END= /DNA_ORIENTATION=